MAAYRWHPMRTGRSRACGGPDKRKRNCVRNCRLRVSAIGREVRGSSDALEHDSREARMHATVCLGELGQADADCVEAVAKAVADPSVQVRRSAVEALGLMKDPVDVTIPGLECGLQDADGQVRFTAAQSLQRLGPKAEAALPALQTALRDENRYVRAYAVMRCAAWVQMKHSTSLWTT